MTRALAVSAWLLLGAACGRLAPAAPPDSFPQRVRAAVDSFRTQHGIPGIAVGIIRGGKPVFLEGFGTRRLGFDSAVTARTVFHMASVTKPFVATAVMQLVEQRKVDLDAPVSRYVPDFHMKDARAAEIPVRQVLNHTAGLPDVTDYRWDHPEYDAESLDRYIRGLGDSTLIFAPGTKWAYSNIGFELLADMVAKVSGELFEEYVQRHILAPVGMRHSTLLMTDVDSANLTVGHTRRVSGRVGVSPVYPYNRRHAGSSTLHSNVEDMLRWAMVNLHHGELDGQRILAAQSYDLLWTPTRDITSEIGRRAQQAGMQLLFQSFQIGLSWFVLQYKGHRLINHSGGDRGFRTDLLLAPDDSAAVVVLANDEGADVNDLSRTLLDLLLR